MAEEKRFENRIKSLLNKYGAYYFKYWAGPFSKSGIPDVIACLNGVFIAVEVKATRGKPSPLQIVNCRRINVAGGIGVIIYPKDYEFLKSVLEEVSRCGTVTATLKHTVDAHMRGFYDTLSG